MNDINILTFWECQTMERLHRLMHYKQVFRKLTRSMM